MLFPSSTKIPYGHNGLGCLILERLDTQEGAHLIGSLTNQAATLINNDDQTSIFRNTTDEQYSFILKLL